LWAMIEIKSFITFAIKVLWTHSPCLKLVASENDHGVCLNCDIYIFKIVCKIWSECMYMVAMGCIIVVRCISANAKCSGRDWNTSYIMHIATTTICFHKKKNA
jgi:hypothetical protein